MKEKTELTKNDKAIVKECQSGKRNSLYMYYQYLIQKCCACQKTNSLIIKNKSTQPIAINMTIINLSIHCNYCGFTQTIKGEFNISD